MDNEEVTNMAAISPNLLLVYLCTCFLNLYIHALIFLFLYVTCRSLFELGNTVATCETHKKKSFILQKIYYFFLSKWP